jgi:transcriptional regulator with XRE-family HTH domain
MKWNNIGDKLYKARLEKGMSQIDVSYAAGLGKNTYPNIENHFLNTGELRGNFKTIMKIANALEVEVHFEKP